MHRPATFAALPVLTRAASTIGDFWVQKRLLRPREGRLRPRPGQDPAIKKKTTHGTADGRKACLHHCLSLGLEGRVDAAGATFSQLSGMTRSVPCPRQVSWMQAATGTAQIFTSSTAQGGFNSFRCQTVAR
ncbi:hypothetical protein [Streptomyces sp. 8N706]|uniref:hypothetical protein n=1 Tax=Streptomyces sp. 8N706 TaxID=3457416 RepID=UPI003FD6AE5B